jgi:hypothetical protein
MANEKREVDLDEGASAEGRMTMAEARAATIRPSIWRDRAYVLMPPWLAEQAPMPTQIVEEKDPTVIARWFSAAVTDQSWYVLAYDRKTGSAHVLNTSNTDPKGKYWALDVAIMETWRTALGLPLVERDLLFTPCPVSKALGKDE